MKRASVLGALLGALGLVGAGVVGVTAAAAAPLCFGQRATIVGTPGGDHITGTSDIDVIYAGAGDDIVVGGNTGTFEKPSGGIWSAGDPATTFWLWMGSATTE
jgi:RTX calcium-binding nonapeptide repeat (4 copies)